MADRHSHQHLGRLEDRRGQLRARARGRVLEIGTEGGARLGQYPPGVEVVAMPVTAAPFDVASFESASFDTVVTTLVLCRVADLDQTATAVRRWLRAGGELLFLEHAVAPGLRGRIQRMATPAWSRLAVGCHLDHDILSALRGAGWLVSDLHHFRFRGAGPLLGDGLCGVARPRPLLVEAAA